MWKEAAGFKSEIVRKCQDAEFSVEFFSNCSDWLYDACRDRVFPFSKQCDNPLSLSGLKRVREHADIAFNRPLVPQELHVSPVDPDLAFGALLLVFVAAERREAPVLGDDDLLAAGEFVLGAAEGFDGCCAVCTVFSQSLHLHPECKVEQLNVRLSRVLTESRIWPMFTRATVPLGLPHAPRMPVCSLSAPAHDNILLMRTTW